MAAKFSLVVFGCLMLFVAVVFYARYMAILDGRPDDVKAAGKRLGRRIAIRIAAVGIGAFLAATILTELGINIQDAIWVRWFFGTMFALCVACAALFYGYFGWKQAQIVQRAEEVGAVLTEKEIELLDALGAIKFKGTTGLGILAGLMLLALLSGLAK